jgi:cation-transporting ATPase 13A3/4/5
MNSVDLVPGDIYEVHMQDFNLVPCDSLLISGDCIVNESMLTGESVPVSKCHSTDLQALGKLDLNEPQLPPVLCKSFLFNGTRLVRVRSSNPEGRQGAALAMAVRTGFCSTKGSLIRSMLFPKPHNFKFYRDSFRFLGVLAFFGLIGFCFSLYNFTKFHQSIRVICLRALDLITIIIPPALPATMSIGTSFAIQRLRKKHVFCISPNHVNIGGKVDIICFDKTGTLTEEGLDVLGVHCCNESGEFTPMLSQVHEVNNDKAIHAMAACHQVKCINEEFVGDPLDIKMFSWTEWILEETVVSSLVRSKKDPSIEVGVIKSFEFTSDLRRMSVITKKLDENFCVYCKGAPEAIRDICRSSTLPSDYNEKLNELSHSGFRVIAIATRELPDMNVTQIEKLGRTDAESDLSFVCFLVFENKLRPGSTRAIETLRNAKIRSVMCTGDNALTAISVSRECGIIDRMEDVFVPRIVSNAENPNGNSKALVSLESHVVWEAFDDSTRQLDSSTLLPKFRNGGSPSGKPYVLAVTGNVFDWMAENSPPELMNRMLFKAQVFARMSPDQKQWLVEKLQAMSYCVSFCGDGANDCGALKAADVGLSLSEAEASVAAPFTSTSHDVNCIIDLIKEGRAALVTSFSCFKYMALYSFIQFTSVTTLYTLQSSISDPQFLYIDMAIILPLAITSTFFLSPFFNTANLFIFPCKYC